ERADPVAGGDQGRHLMQLPYAARAARPHDQHDQRAAAFHIGALGTVSFDLIVERYSVHRGQRHADGPFLIVSAAHGIALGVGLCYRGRSDRFVGRIPLTFHIPAHLPGGLRWPRKAAPTVSPTTNWNPSPTRPLVRRSGSCQPIPPMPTNAACTCRCRVSARAHAAYQLSLIRM